MARDSATQRGISRSQHRTQGLTLAKPSVAACLSELVNCTLGDLAEFESAKAYPPRSRLNPTYDLSGCTQPDRSQFVHRLQHLVDWGVGGPRIVAVTCGGRSGHGGARPRRAMFITRRRPCLAPLSHHCPACPGRMMFPVGRRSSCQRERVGAAFFKETSLHADKLRGGGDIGLGIVSGFEPSLDGDKLRRGGNVAPNSLAPRAC